MKTWRRNGRLWVKGLCAKLSLLMTLLRSWWIIGHRPDAHNAGTRTLGDCHTSRAGEVVPRNDCSPYSLLWGGVTDFLRHALC